MSWGCCNCTDEGVSQQPFARVCFPREVPMVQIVCEIIVWGSAADNGNVSGGAGVWFAAVHLLSQDVIVQLTGWPQPYRGGTGAGGCMQHAGCTAGVQKAP